MGALLGFAVGYFMGTRNGALSIDELARSFQAIRTSDEFRAVQAGAVSMAQDTFRKTVTARDEAQRNEMMRAVVQSGVTLLAKRLAA